MRALSIKGLILAIIATLLLDIVSGIALMIGLDGPSMSENMTDEQMSDALIALTQSTSYLVGSMILGTLSTVVGGFIAARVARNAPYLNAGVFAACGVLLGIMFVEDLPFWFNAIGFALIVPAALLGGKIGVRRE